ncbi:hypothetical protein FFL01_12940 [Flavobacterium flevense]|uniref:Uncharacterized protein n=1 Tax=Flavobacterium flevense TaxID=983 RepID=A0A4Y4AU71_9FLAO|nr:hypothetical protein FFL01_12940 [Flavobacterium flevense]
MFTQHRAAGAVIKNKGIPIIMKNKSMLIPKMITIMGVIINTNAIKNLKILKDFCFKLWSISEGTISSVFFLSNKSK